MSKSELLTNLAFELQHKIEDFDMHLDEIQQSAFFDLSKEDKRQQATETLICLSLLSVGVLKQARILIRAIQDSKECD